MSVPEVNPSENRPENPEPATASAHLADASAPTPTEWLAMPDLVDVLDEALGRVRRLIDEHYLVGSRRTGVFAVPSVFIVDGSPLPSLRGTIIVLQDAGFSDDEVIDWLLAPEEELGRSPIDALLAGHKSSVRRIARTLA
ncbi:Rv2175c family DNA-binding protein [Microbacterium foliorum]|uniref:Rv2175c family DNA-binding protein n=1 Tax=Microbacterium foliorum TaxID=104336 RepID=UPI0037C8A98B